MGNPLAVITGADDISVGEMQRVASWLGFSETTFLLEPTEPNATYRCRIFTPGEELPFAGHPTLGTAHAWSELSGRHLGPGQIVFQQCGAGMVRLRLAQTPVDVRPSAESAFYFEAPPLVREGPVSPQTVAGIVDATGLEPDDVVDAQWVDNGPGWVALLLRDAATVFKARPACTSGAKIGLVGFYPEGCSEDGTEGLYEVRAFFDKGAAGVAEDPVTGSLNASVAQWLVGSGRARPPYVATQGRAVGARGRVYVQSDSDGQVWVGGATATCARGRFSPPVALRRE